MVFKFVFSSKKENLNKNFLKIFEIRLFSEFLLFYNFTTGISCIEKHWIVSCNCLIRIFSFHISANPFEFSILAFNINLKINYSFATKHRSLSINSHQNDGHFVLTLKTILIYDGHFSIQNQCKNTNSHQNDGFFILTLKTILKNVHIQIYKYPITKTK